MRCSACNESSVSGNRAMIFSNAARAESTSTPIFKCQSASRVHAAATCRGCAPDEAQKLFNVISAPGKSFISSA